MIEATVNIRGILDGFDRMKRRDQRNTMSKARKPVRVDLRDHAKSMSDSGGRWPGRAASTRERRGNRRKLLGRLPTAIRITSGSDFVRAVSIVRWGNVHNRGGRAGNGATIPRRQFMWVSRRLVREVRDLLRASVIAAWRR